MGPPGGVHHIASYRQVLQVARAQDVLGLRRQWQQANHDCTGGKEVGQRRVPRIHLHTAEHLGAPTPTGHGILKMLQRHGDTLSEYAAAHDAHREILSLARASKRPLTSPHILFVSGKLAEVTHDGLQDILSHLHRHPRIVETDHC